LLGGVTGSLDISANWTKFLTHLRKCISYKDELLFYSPAIDNPNWKAYHLMEEDEEFSNLHKDNRELGIIFRKEGHQLSRPQILPRLTLQQVVTRNSGTAAPSEIQSRISIFCFRFPVG